MGVDVRLSDIKFQRYPTRDGRIHHLSAEDILVVLRRLPPETYQRLRTITFADPGKRIRELAWVQPGHRDVSLVALPERLSLNGFMFPGQEPEHFGANWALPWPPLAMRRFLLYDVLLHELGHMQIVPGKGGSARRRFAEEWGAHEFAITWRERLWAEKFEHEDPVHRAPTEAERAPEG